MHEFRSVEPGQSALIEVRLFPWRPRRRVMSVASFRNAVSNADPSSGVDDLAGFVVVLGLWLAILVAAPLIVILLAWLLFSVELPLLVAIALLLLLARFAGAIPWTVVVRANNGTEQRESTRSIARAIRRVREVNGGRRVLVRWLWV